MASPTVWNRLSYALVFLLVAAGTVFTAQWYLPEIRRNQELQARKLEEQRRIQAAQAHVDQLTFELAELLNNPKAVERVARERLRYARPGETVIFFVPPADPPPTLPGPALE